MKTENIALKTRTRFKSSNGLPQKFKYRHNIVSMKIPCEHSPGDAGNADKCYNIWHQCLNSMCYIKNHCAQKNTFYSAQLNIMAERCTRTGWCVGQVDYPHESKFINNITMDSLKTYKNNCLEENGHPLHWVQSISSRIRQKEEKKLVTSNCKRSP